MPRTSVLSAALASFVFAGVCAPSFVAADAPVEAKAETVTIFGDGTMEVPSEFKRVPTQSRILDHEFAVTEGEGDDAKTARLTMMASGGGVAANIKRWQGQFAGGDAKAKNTEEMEVGKWKIHVVDNNGSFAERMGGGPFAGGKVIKREDWGMTGVILAHPEGRMYFVKMIGPHSVVKANRDALVKMIKSIK